MNLAELTALTEDDCRAYLEKIRWPDGAVCPHCGSKEVTELRGVSTTRGTYKCKSKACRKKFTVRVGTIFESSHIKLRHWVMAFHLMCASKKGISAHQLHRSIGVTYKTAWFMCHRIRHAMEEGSGLLSGTVECDETYVGGKPRVPGSSKRGAGTKKQPVMVLVERDGRANCLPVENVDASSLKSEIRVRVTKDSVIMTDELSSYRGIGKEYARHVTVNHKSKKYARRCPDGFNANTNTAESFFALLKRGHYGVFHNLSKRHIQRYCHEFAFRWNHRKVSDGARMIAAIQGAEGKRLTYK